MVEWQAEHVLTPPDVDRDDRGYESRMRAWADRLASAVRAEIITESQARAVWDRAGGRDVAA
jgi:hypothetical protein